MLIKFSPEDGGSSSDPIVEELAWHLRKRIRIPITIEQGGSPRDVTLCGNLLAFDPTSSEIPLLEIGALARLFLPGPTEGSSGKLKNGTVLKVRSRDGREVSMDATGTAAGCRLQDGDRLILPAADWSLIAEDAASGDRFPPIRVAVPEWSFHRSFGMGSRPSSVPRQNASGAPVGPPAPVVPPTLLELLADVLSPELDRRTEVRQLGDDALFAALAVKRGFLADLPVILPRPDFSSIRVRRPTGDGGESVIAVNLTNIIARCRDDTDPGEVRASDMPLLPGDFVEFSLRPAVPGQPWTGLSPAEERMFRKAVGGRISIREPDGLIHDLELTYHQPAWRMTPAGLLPFAPADGTPSTRASRLRLPQRSIGEITRGGEPIQALSFLREGDRMRVDFYDYTSKSFGRVVPPSTNSPFGPQFRPIPPRLPGDMP
jgi:hypothetical protein